MSTPRTEKESMNMDALASAFARALLMPETAFRAACAARTTNGRLDTRAVAAVFHVTQTDAHVRAVELGIARAW